MLTRAAHLVIAFALILPLTAAPDEREATSPILLNSFVIRDVQVSGNTVFGPEQLKSITSGYVNRPLTADDLDALRIALTKLYTDRGYLNSGALIPDQNVSNGVLRVHLVEGVLDKIEVEGNRWLTPGYIKSRVRVPNSPVNQAQIEERLALLQLDDRIQRFSAELMPGARLGSSILRVRVEEKLPIRAVFSVNNFQSPTVGSIRGLVTLIDQSLTRRGDVIALTYGRSSGVNPLLDFSYAVPLTAADTTVTAAFRRNNFAVVEEAFQVLDVKSESQVYEVGLRQPLLRRPGRELALGVIGQHATNKTFLLGQPFSFSAGAREGKSTVASIQFYQEWTQRTLGSVVAARSRFSLGVGTFGATTNPSVVNGVRIPDSRFLAWVGQFQFTRGLAYRNSQVLARTDLQLANRPLLPLAQIPIGGRASVRGYRENQMVRDQGFSSSLEWRVPVLRRRPWVSTLALAPFVDVGHGWNLSGPPESVSTLASVGMGIRWTPRNSESGFSPVFEVYWGHRLRSVNTAGGNLQDAGIHFEIGGRLF